MDIGGLRNALQKQPFELFAIRLADGRSIPVRHPEFVALSPRRAIVIAEDDSWSMVEPLLIVSLDYDGKSSGNNGPTKRKRKS